MHEMGGVCICVYVCATCYFLMLACLLFSFSFSFSLLSSFLHCVSSVYSRLFLITITIVFSLANTKQVFCVCVCGCKDGWCPCHCPVDGHGYSHCYTLIVGCLFCWFNWSSKGKTEEERKRKRKREREREKQGHQLIEDDDCIVAGHCLIAICDERVRDKFKFLIVHCRASIKVIKRHQGKNV